jgi:hypothetical protein
VVSLFSFICLFEGLCIVFYVLIEVHIGLELHRCGYVLDLI